MTEMASSNVFDLIYPSPATLQEISSGVLVSGLWRWEVENRENDDFYKFLSELKLCKNLLPNTPSPIKRMMKVYCRRFISSLNEWLSDHYMKLFHFHHDDKFRILRDFYDFICDRHGNIHFLHTARRMMICDRLSNDEKFKIACMYCFEDDIRRIWPSVSEKLDLNEINFGKTPELFYWICMLRNEPDRIPNYRNHPIHVVMLRACLSRFYRWSSVLYFWNRICPENRLTYAIYVSQIFKETFVRFILPTLSDQLLHKFVAERGSFLMEDLLTNCNDKFCALPTWMYIRNRMNENNYPLLIKSLIKSESNYEISEDYLDEGSLFDRSSTVYRTYLRCEVWKSSSDTLKRSAIKFILTQDQLFSRICMRLEEFKETRFLFTVLSDASFEERNAFWHKNWCDAMVDMSGADLHRMMKLCFKDENDIIRFKETSMAEYGNIGPYCNMLMKLGNFEKLNDILIFCCTDTTKRKVIKQHLIQSWFFDDSLVIKERHLTDVELMIEFINDACDNAEIAANFKNGFASLRRVEFILIECLTSSFECTSDHLIHFIETFVQTQEVTVTLKQDILNCVRDFLIGGNVTRISVDDLQTILLWCLGNDDEVTNFKLSLSINNVFRLVSSEANLSELKTQNPNFAEFLKWYFRTPEEIEKFEKGFADQSKM
ncbi:uncharacterized protein LOC135834500 isoform X17 [Planococcus citri]|uniref:uncharacterized protein LOC135834500 isoform X17 n=1 Tax=Planococcus citri TaxID=170843 RepID=UPI0031F9494E